MDRRILSAACILILAAFARPAASQQGQEAFEVASVKPMGDAPGEALAAFGGGCDGSFRASRTTGSG